MPLIIKGKGCLVMRRFFSAFALGAMISLAPVAGASAQSIRIPQSASSLDNEIIVQGERRLERKEIDRAIDTLTRRSGMFQPVTRFMNPVCVLVIGLGESLDNKIAGRIRENVSALGLKLADEDCRPNAITIITNNPSETFNTIYHKRNFLIGHPDLREYSLNTVKEQLRAGKPAVSWSIWGFTPSQGGMPFPNQAGLPGFWGWNAASPLGSGGRPRRAAVLLLDWKQINGAHVHQLADFATVHLLGSPRTAADPREAKVPTILTLFEDGPKNAPQRLTTFDRAYLCGLYSMRNSSENPRINTALNTRLNKNIREVYDSECVRVGAPASETKEPAER